jgi:hypothetical protein
VVYYGEEKGRGRKRIGLREWIREKKGGRERDGREIAGKKVLALAVLAVAVVGLKQVDLMQIVPGGFVNWVGSRFADLVKSSFHQIV